MESPTSNISRGIEIGGAGYSYGFRFILPFYKEKFKDDIEIKKEKIRKLKKELEELEKKIR